MIACLLVLSGLIQTAVSAAENDPAALVTAFWTADTEAQRLSAAETLREQAADVATLYRWLRRGPHYSSAVPTGIVEDVRTGSDGLEFPYVLIVPQSYDPARSYPVEFMLHGGVSRPAPEAGDVFWRRGYDSLLSADRITVVPAAWNDAFWWFPNQAENLPAILKRLKRDYNIDDNRVYLAGVSDGGTGAWFFAFHQPTHWAAFFPYIGHPGVLRNPAGRVSYQLYFENITTRPFYIVNGEEDPLYPAASLQSFVDVLSGAGIEHVFRSIEGGGHNTNWLPAETPAIESFKNAHERDPFPDSLQWVTESAARFNQLHWLRVDALERETQPGMVKAERQGNTIRVETVNVDQVTVLLNPDEIDLQEPVAVYLNGTLKLSAVLRQDAETLLRSAAHALDRSLLYTVELPLRSAD